MNNPTTTNDTQIAELLDDLELQQDNSSAIDKAFLWLIRTGIFAVVCFTLSAIVHDVYLTSVIAHLA